MKQWKEKRQLQKAKKNTRGGLFAGVKRFFFKLKKLSDYEKEKKDARKFKNDSVKPQGYMARKAGSMSFWAMFGFMFLVTMVTVFSNNSSRADINYEQIFDEMNNPSASAEAIQFAENFARHYYTWEISDEGRYDREIHLSRFLVDGIDSHAGVDVSKSEWNSTAKKAELREIDDRGNHIAHITVYVEQELSEASGDGRKTVDRYLIVPVAYDGHSYGVYELPKFTFINEETTVKRVINNRMRQVESNIRNDVREFLHTFYSSFSQDPQEKLNYLLLTEDVTSGLQQSFIFDDIKQTEVFEGDNELEYIVFSEVDFTDPTTSIPFTTQYELRLVKREGRFMVADMKGLEDKIIESVFEQEDEENDDSNNDSNDNN